MTISEALEISRAKTHEPQQDYNVVLACSFTPLHLQTFLAAHLKQRNPRLKVNIRAGVFGDLAGTLENAAKHPADAIAIAIEWQDLDQRLGYREAGTWGPALETDLFQSLPNTIQRLETAIAQAAASGLAAVSLPTLPFPPAFHGPRCEAGGAELLLKCEVMALAQRLSSIRNVRVLNAEWLANTSPTGARLDLKSDLLIGSPYSLGHADALAAGLAHLLLPAQPLKGIIVDLDNTFWNGIVGEVGADAVRWDSASSYHLHGLFQKTLCALADEGVLVGVASKNDPAVVGEAFKRADLLIPPEKIFPIEVHWAAKSESVARILKAWNISADAVAFVDDTPLELAEVANAHPGITCLQFPAGDYHGVLALLKKMRDLFGKHGAGQATEEDRLRLESLRKGAEFKNELEQGGGSEEFLKQVNATVTLDWEVAPDNPRILELVNKTNQFNLNGSRYTAAEWQKSTARPGSFVIAVKYEDKFGPLGTIAVIHGTRGSAGVNIDSWVMSCRAFSRRIEHQCLRAMFAQFGVPEIALRFAETAKNGPVRDFLAANADPGTEGRVIITQKRFRSVCPALYHRVEELTGVQANG